MVNHHQIIRDTNTMIKDPSNISNNQLQKDKSNRMHQTLHRLSRTIMTSSSILTPLKDLKVAKHQIPAYGWTPNTSIQNKPLLVYKEAFKQGTSAAQIEEHLRGIGEVEPAWRYTVSFDLSAYLYLLKPFAVPHAKWFKREGKR